VLQAIRQYEKTGLNRDEVYMAAFEDNKSDLKRVSGN
jgi:hypothetical protein